MIRTSLHGRSARGRAAETAARPPTRTKSSISVVTNKTLKGCPVPARRRCKKTNARRVMQEQVQRQNTSDFGCDNAHAGWRFQRVSASQWWTHKLGSQTNKKTGSFHNDH